VNQSVEDEIEALVSGVDIDRIAGETRYRTAESLASELIESANFLFIAAGSSQVDALSIAPASFALADPLLLSTPFGLDDGTVTSVTAWNVANPSGRIVLVGGKSVLPAVVEEQLAQLGIGSDRVVRLEGADRYATSALAVQWITANVSGFDSGSMGFASGQSPIDSLTSAPFLAGGALRSPLLLVPPCGSLPAVTRTTSMTASKQILIGGPAAVCEALALALKER
jgi:putative cell wall-binding protein